MSITQVTQKELTKTLDSLNEDANKVLEAQLNSRKFVNLFCEIERLRTRFVEHCGFKKPWIEGFYNTKIASLSPEKVRFSTVVRTACLPTNLRVHGTLYADSRGLELDQVLDINKTK